MDANLENSLNLVFGHEGGYVNAATDRGGPTKYGITHRTLAAWRGVQSVTASEVKALTLDEAAEIYRVGYWAQSGGSVLPSGLDYATFDFGVNSGPSRAVKELQRVVGAEMDGSIGPMTMAAVREYPGGVRKLIVAYCEARMAFLRSLRSPKTGFPVNGRGWTIRVTGKDPKGQWADQPGVIGHALAMVGGRAQSAPTTAPTTAKAPEEKVNPWMKPETIVQALPAAGGLGFLAEGDGPVQIAIGVALVVAAGVAAWLIVSNARKNS